MPCIPIANGILTIGGPTYRIMAGGKEFRFELPWGSLVVVGENDEEIKDPPMRSPFWKAVELWREQGKKIGADSFCIYDPDLEEVEILEHLGGRNYKVIGYETVGERRKRLEKMT